MQPSNTALELIKSFEGFRARLYRDVAGHPTIGYGHRLLPHESFPDDLATAQAEVLLKADAARAAEAVVQLVQIPLSQSQFDALVDFVFNLGPGRLATSTLLRLLNQRCYEAAGNQLLRWDRADGQENEGLRARRQAELALWQSPTASPGREAV
jgi:lysozyme